MSKAEVRRAAARRHEVEQRTLDMRRQIFAARRAREERLKKAGSPGGRKGEG